MLACRESRGAGFILRRASARHVSNLALLFLCIAANGYPADAGWLRLRAPHFDLLTDAGEPAGRDLLRSLDLLRRAVSAQPLLPAASTAQNLRIIAFRSAEEYDAHRLSDSSDAYYANTGDDHYIVMTLRGPHDFSTLAHEYAHSITHENGLDHPAWLSEGISEVFSTVQIKSGTAIIGLPDPARLQTLRRVKWLPLADVVAYEPALPHAKEERQVFYAESWALTHLLMFSPAYRARFGALLSGGRNPAASYGTTLAELEHDAHAWVAGRILPLSIPLDSGAGAPASVEEVPEPEAQLALADLDLATGHREQAAAVYRRLESALPRNPALQAALGKLALLSGDPAEARRRFSKALDLGIRDARLCYQYAMLAQNANAPDEDVIPVLERTLAIDPSLEDAHYSLALALRRAGKHREALAHLQKVHHIPEGRAFAYYTAMAHSQLELGLNDDAAKSAAQAGKHARTDDQIGEAVGLGWMARSELVAQLMPDGTSRLTRIPRRGPATADEWNPFIEPADRIVRREGELRNVECSDSGIRLTVWADGQAVILGMADPSRVRVRHSGEGPFEFVCGRQEGQKVAVEYAATATGTVAGVLRGIRFLP